MRTTTAAAISLLATGKYVRTDLWTITLNGGQVVRWTSSDQGPVKYGGNSWIKGPALERGAISEKLGPDTATLELTITARNDLPSDLINGAAVIPFIAGHGLDGATVKLERAYAPDWPTMYGSGPVGTSIRFAGLVTSINSIQGAVAKVTISSWMALLNVDMPRNLYQAACMHSLYDSGCALNPAIFAGAGHFTAAYPAGTNVFATSLSPPGNGYYSLGRLVMATGANTGISRTIKTDYNNGTIMLMQPFPNAIANGDAFQIFPGCDLTRSTCLNKFNNLNNYKATDFVPIPTTPLTIPASTTTTTSGKGGE